MRNDVQRQYCWCCSSSQSAAPRDVCTTDSRVKVKMLAYDTASESDFDQGHCSYHPPGLRDLRSKIHIQILTQNTTEVAKFEWLVSSFALT